MKSKLVFSITAFLISSVTFGSDLSKDLKTPFEPLTNPFEHVKEQPLQKWVSLQVKSLMEACAYTPVKYERMKIVDSARLRPGCERTIVVNRNQNQMQIVTPNLKLFVVTWDGSDSDGGDQQALGVYDQSGRRIAVYPGLYLSGNVIDGLAYAVDAQVPEVRH